MKIVVTGADEALGGLLCRGLYPGFEVLALGLKPQADRELGGVGYHQVDLRVTEEVEPLLNGVGAVVHIASCGLGENQSEQEMLDVAARGTYVLITAACRSAVQRVVLISTMALVEDYPEDYVVGPHWQPRPEATAASLGPYMAELTGREIARAGLIEVSCLRFGAIDPAHGTSPEDGIEAVRRELDRAPYQRGHSWTLQHVVSGGRFKN